MEKYLIYLLAGFAGGIIRGLVGFVKNKTVEKANHFKPEYFLITIAISGIVGAAAGILADTEWQVSFWPDMPEQILLKVFTKLSSVKDFQVLNCKISEKFDILTFVIINYL